MFTRDEALDRVERAGSAADLFGTFDPTRRKDAQRLYRRLAAVLHPDRTGAGDPRAHAASAELTRLHHEWQHGPSAELRTPQGTYRLTDRHAVGSVANVYRTDGPHVV